MAALVLLVIYVLFFHLLDDVESAGAKGFALLFVLVGVGGLYGSLRLLTRPVDLLTAYRDGVMFHRGERGYVRQGLFVPWALIRGVSLSSRERVDDQGIATIPTIGFEVACGPDWNPPDHLTSRRSADLALLHLDLPFGGKDKRKVLAKIEHLMRQSG